jgi:RecJ-like exonuclease
VDINATVTANIEGHSVSSEEIAFSVGQQVTVELSIRYKTYYTCTTLLTKIELLVNTEEINCPKCVGQGTITQRTNCSKCDGTRIL